MIKPLKVLDVDIKYLHMSRLKLKQNKFLRILDDYLQQTNNCFPICKKDDISFKTYLPAPKHNSNR